MQADDLREESRTELLERLEDLKREAFNLRFQQATGLLRNSARLRQIRRDVARVKTVLNERSGGARGSRRSR